MQPLSAKACRPLRSPAQSIDWDAVQSLRRRVLHRQQPQAGLVGAGSTRGVCWCKWLDVENPTK